MKFKLVLLTALLLSALSCSSTTEVSGEAFVAMPNQGNQKVGLVEISVYTEKEINTYLAEMSNEKEVAKLKDEYEQAKAFLAQQSLRNEPGLWNAAEARRWEAKRDLRRAIGPERIFASLPTAKLIAQTDSTGKFKFSIPKNGRYAVAAKGVAKFVYGDENYYWLIWVNADGTPKTIVLNNNNMPNTGSPESVLAENKAICDLLRKDAAERGDPYY